jgi:hypothetical protein
MRKIKFQYSTGYCGMDEEEIVEFPDNVTDAELDAYAHDRAIDNALQYGVEPLGDDDDPWGDQEDEPCYIGDNISGTWEDYNE